MLRRYQIDVTTDGSGNFTGYTEKNVRGKVVQVGYVPGAQPIDTNGDIDITGETTGTVIANHDNIGTAAFTKVYKQPVHTAAGVASVYAGTDGVLEYVYICDERIKLVVANGASAKTGKFYIWVDETQ